MGDGRRCLDLVEKVVEETEIPISQFLPTHVNRNPYLFESAMAFAKKGGTIDLTGNEDADYWEKVCGEVRCSKAYKAYARRRHKQRQVHHFIGRSGQHTSVQP